MTASWPDRILCVWGRVGIALVADPAATVAAAAVFLGSLAAVAYIWHLTVRLERWIDRRLTLHRLRREIDAIPEPDESCDDMHHADTLLAEIFDHRQAPPTARHDLHRTPPARPAGHRIPRLRRDRHRNRV